MAADFNALEWGGYVIIRNRIQRWVFCSSSLSKLSAGGVISPSHHLITLRKWESGMGAVCVEFPSQYASLCICASSVGFIPMRLCCAPLVFESLERPVLCTLTVLYSNEGYNCNVLYGILEAY
jgi:hypothetical protein